MGGQRNIIIIEDNETFSLLVTHYLKTNLGNTKVYVENSGAKAIDSIKRLKPSLVVLDYYLENDLSAKDVMNVINSMAPKPKVILLSSITDEKEKNEVMKMGIQKFVPKSNESFYDLVRTIEELLDDAEGAHVESKGSASTLQMNKLLFGVIAGIILFIVVLLLLFV